MKLNFFIIVICVAIGVTSCNKNASVNYAGVYEGDLPCNACDKVITKLTLSEDQHYVLYEIYKLAEGDEIKRMTGEFEWTDHEGVFRINQPEAMPLFFKVEEHKLIRLNDQAKPFEQPENYTLTQVEDTNDIE